MTVTVRLFARARDLAETDRLALAVTRSAPLGAVRVLLLERCPALKSLSPSLLAAVNSEYASDDCLLREDDEIAFFPPVSGG